MAVDLREPSGAAPLLALGAAVRRIAGGAASDDALSSIAGAVAAATAADVVVIRVRVDDALEARAVEAASSAVAAELQGSRIPLTGGSPSTAEATLAVPIRAGEELAGRLELSRA